MLNDLKQPLQQCIGEHMKLFLFFKLFLISLAASLFLFALLPQQGLRAGILFFAQMFALGIGLSILISLAYPEFRGVQKGDTVSVMVSSALPSLIGKIGKALSQGRKNSEIRVRFDNGEEAVGIIESYAGIISPPRVRIIYEERMIEER